MTRSFTPETLLSHLLTALGLGSAAVGAVTACGCTDRGPLSRSGDAATTHADHDAPAIGGAAGSDGRRRGHRRQSAGGAGGIPPICHPLPPRPSIAPASHRAMQPWTTGAFRKSLMPVQSKIYRYICFPAPPDGGTCADTFKPPVSPSLHVVQHLHRLRTVRWRGRGVLLHR